MNKKINMLKTIKTGFTVILLSALPAMVSVSYAEAPKPSSQGDQKIELSLREVEIAEAMQMLSKQQRVNILLSKGVSGKVSINLYDMSLGEAIHLIANTAGYEAEKRGNTYFVINRDDVGSYVDNGTTQIVTFNLNYAKAEDVREILEEYLSRYGSITELKDRNILVVEDRPEFLKRITGLVKKLDYQPRQIVIEARILEITLDDSEAYGIEWAKFFSIQGADGVIGRGIPANNLSGLFLEIIDDDLRIFLDLLQREGRTRTLSTPKLLTVENKKASVIVGDRLGYVNTVTINQVTTENTEFLATTAVDTHLLVPNGATSFIGGLIKTQVFNDLTGVPVVSKIPLLGKLFSRKEKRKINTEIIVLITPTIVDTADEKWQKGEKEKVDNFNKKYNEGET